MRFRFTVMFAPLVGILGAAAMGAALDWFSKLRDFQIFGSIVSRVPIEDKVVALTFDDGPNPACTPRVLRVLERHGCRATFFLIGMNMERYPGIARATHEAGHELGNHTFSHRRLVFRLPSECTEEVVRTDELIERAGAPCPVNFRAPYLRKLGVLPYVLRRLGKLHVTFDVAPWPPDYAGTEACRITESVLGRVRPGSIVGFHDGAPAGSCDRANVVAALPDILGRLADLGYTVVSVSELLLRAGLTRHGRARSISTSRISCA